MIEPNHAMHNLLPTTMLVSRQVLDKTYSFLNAAGHQGREALVLWAGARTPSSITVSAALTPAQESSHHGCNLHVDAAEMAHLNRALDAKGLSLVAQVHTHPGAAFHSQTDDLFPALHHRGAISLVVPYFAQMSSRAFSTLNGFSAHVLAEWPHWDDLPVSALKNVLVVEE